MQETVAKKILVIDDDDTFRSRLIRAFETRGLQAQGAANYDEAIAAEAKFAPNFAVIDMRMPGPSGLEIVRAFHEKRPELVTVILTGYGSIATAVEAVRLGAKDYLTKPVDADQILTRLGLISGEDATGKKTAQVPSLERVEWEHIQRVLADCDGNVSKAARVLGVHRRTLQRKLAYNPPHR